MAFLLAKMASMALLYSLPTQVLSTFHDFMNDEIYPS